MSRTPKITKDHPDAEAAIDAACEVLADILANGYNSAVQAFTRGISTNVDKVMAFETIFDRLTLDGTIHWEGTATQLDLIQRVESSLGALETFLSGGDPNAERFLLFTNHGHEITIEFGWLGRAVTGQYFRVTWDRWTEDCDDPVMAYADLGFMFDLKKYECGQKPREPVEPPLYRYHPERFKATREYAEIVGKFYRHYVDPASGMLTVDQINSLGNQMLDHLNERSMRYPRKLKVRHPSPSLVQEAELSLATAYGRFVQSGRQIMDFPPALMEVLAKTDIDDIPLDSIRLPFASQYLYFGEQADLELAPGWFVDGAYVEQRGAAGDVRFTLTAAPKDHNLSWQWYLFPEAQYTQDFVGEFRSMDLATAIDTVLSARLADLRTTRESRGGDITRKMQDQAAEQGAALPEGVCIVDVSPEMAVQRDEITRHAHPVYRSAMQLVVNALCYVSAYPDDIDTVWPEGTPESLKAKVQSGRGKEIQRAKSKLASLGYVPVHICGKRIIEQRLALGTGPSGQGHPATHWRRGHWRNQVHGPGRALRKLVWVMPVIVGKGSHDNPESGHVYLVT